MKRQEDNYIWTMKRPPGVLVATDDWGRAIISRLAIGRPVETSFRQPRNSQMHRKLWALVTIVWQATGNWSTPYEVLKELKKRMGFYDDVVDKDTGYAYREYRSISFARMDQTMFNVFFEQALAHMCEIAGGIENSHLRQAVMEDLVTH